VGNGFNRRANPEILMTNHQLPDLSRELAMKNHLCSLILMTGIALSMATASHAVVPVVTSHTTNVEWSKVMNDPFDGAVVYDKNFDPGGRFEFISRWSPKGIQATYRSFYSQLIGYQPLWPMSGVRTRSGYYRIFTFPEYEPVYRRFGMERTPTAIKFAINGQVYTYEQGDVSPELATALASAPDQNMTIRLMWEDGGATDIAIGRGTVAAWKIIFRPNATPATGVQ